MPLHVGAAIILNHALYGGMLHIEATPVTKDRLHAELFAYKFEKLRNDPHFLRIINDDDRDALRKADAAAFHGLPKIKIDLGGFPFGLVSVKRILEIRAKRGTALEEIRKKFGQLAQDIRVEDWTPEYWREVGNRMIPKLNEELKQAIESTKVDWWTVSAAALAAGGFVLSLTIVPSPPFRLRQPPASREKTPDLVRAARSWAKWRGTGRPKDLSYLLEISGAA